MLHTPSYLQFFQSTWSVIVLYLSKIHTHYVLLLHSTCKNRMILQLLAKFLFIFQGSVFRLKAQWLVPIQYLQKNHFGSMHQFSPTIPINPVVRIPMLIDAIPHSKNAIPVRRPFRISIIPIAKNTITRK